ncbi:MAG: flagellar basal body-associated FliL family protein [Gemmatimonadales bacterium]
MSDAAATDGAGVVAPVSGKKAGLVAGLTLAGALAGGLVASLVIAPRIIARSAPPAVTDSAAAEGHAGTDGHPAEGGEAGAAGEGEKKMIQLPNIVVNPAGSQGSRFLMATVAVTVADEEAEKVLRAHEVEFKDKVVSILETLTMAQLSAPGARDTLKLRIGIAAGTIIGPRVPVKVFLPQFVIQ